MYFSINIAFIVICFIYAFFGEKNVKASQRKYVFYFFLIVFCIIMALRPESTPDTLGYISGFERIEPGNFFTWSIFQKYYGYEIGFVYLVKIFKLFSNNCRLFFFIIALVGTSCVTKGLTSLYRRIDETNEISYTQIFAIYIACYGLLYNGISLRAGLAMGFGICFVDKMMEKKRFVALLFLLTSILVQRSGILYLFVYLAITIIPILPKRVHLVIWAIIGILLISGMGQAIAKPLNSLIIYIFTKYNVTSVHYLYELEDSIGSTDILMWLIYGFFIVIDLDNYYYQKYLNVIMVGAFIVLTMYGVRAISRAWDMFYMTMVPLICSLLYFKSSLIKSFTVQRGLVLLLIVVRAYKMFSLVFH